jgi:CheY-like chemotaxis protein
MSPTTLNRIFEPYFTTKAQTGGTGLGLAMVHGIVKTAGGNLTVSSQLGRGSTFVVHLPRVAESTQPQRPAKEEIPRGTESVLVVDDELFIIEILSDMLKSAGYRAEAVNSSTEALQLFRDNPDRFDLVIADYTMPKITGIVLAKEIKALRPDMPVVLTTGLTFDDATDKETLSNFAAILKKPILYKDLAITLRNVLDDATCGK